MPRLSKPPAMPEGVVAIIDAIGNGTRTEILRHLSLRAMNATELAEVIDADPRVVRRHLEVLEDMGLVAADHPRGDRRAKGRVVMWETNKQRVNEVANTWRTYALGQTNLPG
ncbi:DNA-binding transcriptional ArsR family regulator [Nocardioides aromaticivorans]|uniref:DNA-binding transcriptional ArsR family regulator n=1 Tax=Nocardioides aromaticivorans TaxID=200618 RepID=A0A7Z0CNY2_9ACTN|nr:DNA-binding transcriptional ArsR family regulator [Nocardioides aromaticivorans]